MLIVGIIVKMVMLTIMLFEAINKWRQDNQSRKWFTIATMLLALLMVSCRVLTFLGSLHRRFGIFASFYSYLPNWTDLEQHTANDCFRCDLQSFCAEIA